MWERGRQLLDTMWPNQATKYHGLKNQGATCYLNSVLQVLFMTKDFRDAVKRHVCDNPGTEFIDHQLTSLFDDLEKQVTNTYNITKKLGIDNVYEQRDAAEYFEKILRLTSEAASPIFHGESTQKTKCSACHTETDPNEAFWNLPLALGNFYSGDYSVEDGIEEYFRASHFRGEDQMYCDVCEAKSDATIKFEIKRHPEVLMLLLKRFDFDYHYMTYVKINRLVKVPFALQIPENQTYELYAVVDHVGDLRSGHYTATIRSQDDGTWHRFDDRFVSLYEHQRFEEKNIETSSSAYLLFYRKKTVQFADTCTQKIGETSSPGGVPPATNDILNDQCKDAVERSQQVEGAAKADNEPPGACSIEINEEAGIKDIVGVEKTQLGENINDLYDATIRTGDVRHSRPQEGLEGKDMQNTKQIQGVSNMQPQQVCVDTQKDEEKMEIDVNTDKWGSNKGGISSTKYPDGYAEPQDDERFNHVRQNMYDDQEEKHVVRPDDFRPVEQDVGEKMNTEGAKPLTIIAGCYDGIEGKTVGKSKPNRPKDEQNKQRVESRFYQSNENLRVEERDVKGDQQQERGVDEQAHRKGASERQEQDQNGSSECGTTQKDGAESALRRAGRSRVTENRGDGCVEKSQPSKATTALSEDTVEGRHNSKKSKSYQGKISDVETRNGVQEMTVTNNLRITTVEGSSEGSIKSLIEYDEGNTEIKCDPNTDAKVTLPEGFCNLQLNVSSLTASQKRKDKKEKNEMGRKIPSNAERKPNVSDAQELTVGKKHAVKDRAEKRRHLRRCCSPLKKNKQDKKKEKQSCSCFVFLKY